MWVSAARANSGMPNDDVNPPHWTSPVHGSLNLPMMDWSESLRFSMGWKAICARNVEINGLDPSIATVIPTSR